MDSSEAASVTSTRESTNGNYLDWSSRDELPQRPRLPQLPHQSRQVPLMSTDQVGAFRQGLEPNADLAQGRCNFWQDTQTDVQSRLSSDQSGSASRHGRLVNARRRQTLYWLQQPDNLRAPAPAGNHRQDDTMLSVAKLCALNPRNVNLLNDPRTLEDLAHQGTLSQAAWQQDHNSPERRVRRRLEDQPANPVAHRRPVQNPPIEEAELSGPTNTSATT